MDKKARMTMISQTQNLSSKTFLGLFDPSTITSGSQGVSIFGQDMLLNLPYLAYGNATGCKYQQFVNDKNAQENAVRYESLTWV